MPRKSIRRSLNFVHFISLLESAKAPRSTFEANSHVHAAVLGDDPIALALVRRDHRNSAELTRGIDPRHGKLRGRFLSEGAAGLSGLVLAGELFVERPVVVVASKDATTMAVEGNGNAIAAQEALEQVEIALGGFRGEKLRSEDFTGSVILHAESGEQRPAALEPIVRRTVELDELALAGRARRRWR